MWHYLVHPVGKRACFTAEECVFVCMCSFGIRLWEPLRCEMRLRWALLYIIKAVNETLDSLMSYR
jgi:hypothetical protein